MKKTLILLFTAIYLTGCSMAVPAQQKVSVLTNVPQSKIYANGELIGVGQAGEFSTKRNHNAQIMVIADGYYPAYKQLSSELNTTGILDIIGGIIWLVPFIGLCFPGSKSLEQTNVSIQLVPQPATK